MLRLRGVLPVHFCGDREDVIIELVIFLELMSQLPGPATPNNKMTLTGRSWPGRCQHHQTVGSPRRNTHNGVGVSFDTVAQRPQFRRRCGAESDNMKKSGEAVGTNGRVNFRPAVCRAPLIKKQHSVGMLTHDQHDFQIY